MTEEWRVIVGYPDYEVSNKGRVRSHKRKSVKILSPGALPTGYLIVNLHLNGIGKSLFIHILVLEAFESKRPKGYWASHENGINTDNRLVNLKWRTPSDNILLKNDHGTMNIGERNGRARLNAADIPVIFNLAQRGMNSIEIASHYRVTSANIRYILNRKTWRHVEI